MSRQTNVTSEVTGLMCALCYQFAKGTADVVGTCLALGLGSGCCEDGGEEKSEDG